MKIAIENFIEIDNYNIKNKIIIIGDMLELGLYELKEHESIIKMLEKSPLPIENIFLVNISKELKILKMRLYQS